MPVNSTVMVFDLETVPDLAAVARVHGLDPADVDGARAKLGTGFPKLIYHAIVCIGVLIAERQDGAWRVRALGAPHVGERSEAQLITDFSARIEQLRPQLVSFNGGSFDLPAIRYRALIHGLAAPGLTARPYYRRYDEAGLDLCDVLANYDARGKIGLDALCRAMDLPGKPEGIDGGRVADFVAQGRLDESQTTAEPTSPRCSGSSSPMSTCAGCSRPTATCVASPISPASSRGRRLQSGMPPSSPGASRRRHPARLDGEQHRSPRRRDPPTPAVPGDHHDSVVTADTHFGHANILRLSRRPFADIDEHDRALVANWNARVGRQDEVWHLGDIALGLAEPALSHLFDRLNGRKHLVIGNHDARRTLQLPWSSQPTPMHEMVVDHQRVVLCHYAMRSWRRIHGGAVQIYGHTHGTIPGTRHSEDAGVDAWGYAPVALPDLLARMAGNTVVEDELRLAAGDGAER